MKYILTPFFNMFDFKGKANIKEFWIFNIFSFFLSFLVGLILGYFKLSDNIRYIYWGIMLLPYLSLGFRRLNDVGINKFFFLIPGLNILLASLPTKHE